MKNSNSNTYKLKQLQEERRKDLLSGDFSSVAQLCLTLCNLMDCSMPGFPVHYQLPELFFLGMILITASCTTLETSAHSSSGTLSIRSNPLNLFVTSTGTYVILYINYMLIKGNQNTHCLPQSHQVKNLKQGVSLQHFCDSCHRGTACPLLSRHSCSPVRLDSDSGLPWWLSW